MKTTTRMPSRTPASRLQGSLSAGLALMLAAACSDRPGPIDPVPERLISTSVGTSAAPPPAWMPAWFLPFAKDFFKGLPNEAKAKWNACQTSGAIGDVGTVYVTGLNCRIVQVDGYPRRFVVHVPNHPNVVPGNPVPLVLMDHGSSGSGEQFYNISAWVDQADLDGFIAVFPTALEYLVLSSGRISTKWHTYNLIGGIDATVKPPLYPALSPWPADDIAFTGAILDDLEGVLDIDATRIYQAGFSNGAGFTMRVAVEMHARFAAVTAMAGFLNQEYFPTFRIPVTMGMGTDDPKLLAAANANLVPGQAPLTAFPLDAATLYLYAHPTSQRDDATATFDLEPLVFTETLGATSNLLQWTTPQLANADGNVIDLHIMSGVGHQWPRGLGRTRLPNNPQAFDMTATAWAFFQAHPK